jgi:hypothetical protein
MVAAVLEDWHMAPVNERLRSILGFLEKLTVSPGDVGPKDIESMRSVGLTEKANEEATYVCFLFSVMDRLADALGFDMHSPNDFRRGGRMLFSVVTGGLACRGDQKKSRGRRITSVNNTVWVVPQVRPCSIPPE